MLPSFNEQQSMIGQRKINRHLFRMREKTNPTNHTLPRQNKSLCLSLAKMISSGLHSVPNKLIVSRRLNIQNGNNARQTMQNGRSAQAPFFS